MKCTKCGKEYDGNFCPYCGEPSGTQNNVCPKCGRIRNGEERFCSNCGYEFTKDEPNKFVKLKTTAVAAVKRVPRKAWIAAGIAVAVIVVLLAVLIPTISHLTNKFRIDVVERIGIGDKKQDVLDLLGEPYDYEENSSLFTYYSDDYRKLLEKNDSFNPDDIGDWNDFEDAFQEALELEQKLQTEEYKYIEVRFDGEGAVSSVFFDNLRTEQIKDQAKTIESYEVLSDTASILNIADSIQFTARYTDGSYYMSDSVTTLNIESEPYSISWRDRFGNDFEYPLQTDSLNGSYYDETTNTFHIFSNDNITETPADVETVIIYSGVKSINSKQFSNCASLESITIPDSVTSIGSSAFSGCTSLKGVYITDIAAWCSIGFYLSDSNPLSYAHNLYINDILVTDLVIPNGVTAISGYAFSGCSPLTSITIPDSVTSIGYNALSDCINAMDIESSINYIDKWAISCDNSVTSASLRKDTVGIADGAFAQCFSLDSMTIPDSVMNIGKQAFYRCSSMTSITVPDSVTNIDSMAFYACSSLESITIPDSVTSIGESAFAVCPSLTSISIPKGVTEIDQSTFAGCTSLTNITVPDSVTFIDSMAFYACSSLESITIPDSVTSIGESAFSGCTSLTSITIPDSVTSIGESAFSGCTSLTSISIPKGVTEINQSTFAGCTSLTNITVPNSVTFINWWAFVECTSLNTIYYAGNAEQWNKINIQPYNDNLTEANIVFNYNG